MVAGATSGAGKSTVSAALCRLLRRRGLSVAPFKALNMSNHSAVTADGGEIGRAQAMQAAAAGLATDRRMNPILLKPNRQRGSHVVVLGEERQTSNAASFGQLTASLKPLVLEALDSLRRDHRWVIAEGAGGAAEINLLDRDLVNLPLAQAAGIPAILVVDIDQGGAFAAAYGSIGLLPPELRATISGVVFNRFRGDVGQLSSGIAQLTQRTGVPILGVLPHLGPVPLLGVEDSLDITSGDIAAVARHTQQSDRPVRVAVVLLPHLANPSDFDPFLVEPDVSLSWVTRGDQFEAADLVILPGSRATVSDLAWLRQRGLDRAIAEVARLESARVIGICAGYQMLGTEIDDPIESGAGLVPGLGLLQSTARFVEPKIVRRSTGNAGGRPIAGYQIRFGRPAPSQSPWLELDGEPEGAVSASGVVLGTSLHGIFDADGFRSALLTEIASATNRYYSPAPHTFAGALEAQHERLADWIEEHLDINALIDIASTAAPPEEGPGW